MRLFCRWFFIFTLVAVGSAIAAVAPPTLSVSEITGELIVSWPQNSPGFQLESVNSLGGKLVWQSVTDLAVISSNFYRVTLPAAGFTRYFRLGPAPLTTIHDTSPADGDTGVSVFRETILRFTAPLAANTLISPDQFYAVTSARPLLTRVELASDRRSASLFYLEPMTAGDKITAVFDGSGIFDESGRPIDPDGDGLGGGVKSISFETFNTTPLANTAVVGHVFASVPVPGGNGTTTNHPLANVTITVDGQEQSLRATTDQNGAFFLNPCPPGRFFVKIDGRTAFESQYPSGAYYPFVGKPWDAAAGSTNNLAGGTGVIYLPLIAKGTLQPTSLTTGTTITFPPSVLAANPALTGVSITIPANSLFSNDGTRGGKVGIAPVSPDRLPAPLPPGVHPPLVITIQTDGADNLDRPAPVRFPNLPDPVTGKLLPPGAKTALWGFNHKSGRWEIQGPATISPDGHYIDSDPGYGVRQPGWELFDPGNNGNGGGGGPPYPTPNPPPGNGPPDPSDPCKTERKALESNSIQCVAGTGISILATLAKSTPGLGCAISAMQGVIGSVADCNNDPTGCKTTIAQNLINTAIGCVPVLGAGVSTFSTVAGALKSCVLDESLAYGNYANCKQANGLSLPVNGQGPTGNGFSLSRAKRSTGYFGDAIPENIWEEQLALLQGVADVETLVFGDVAWTEVDAAEVPILINFFTALQAAMQTGSRGDAQITPEERANLLALPLPSNITAMGAARLVDRMALIAAGTLPASELDLAALLQKAVELQATLTTLTGRGWTTVYDAFFRGLTQPFQDENAAQSSQPQSTKAMVYRVVDLSANGAPQYGHLNLNGQIDNLILNANDLYEIDYADVETFYVGHTIFQATGAGQATTIPKAVLGPGNPLDSDGDGLPDEVELALGTNPHLADTDGDGVSDGAEIAAGTDPLVAGPAVIGITGSAPSQAEMTQIALSGSLALVAEGSAVAVYNIAGVQPALVSLMQFSGTVNCVAFSGNLGVATIDGSGVAVIDVSNPLIPQVARYIGINGSGFGFLKVAASGNLAYALTGDTLYLLDIAQGLLLDQRHIDVSGEHAQPQDVAVSGGYVYLLTGHTRTYSGDNPGQHHLHKIVIDEVIGADVATLDMAGTNYVADVPTQIAATPGFVYFTGLNASTNSHSSGLAIIADSTNGLQMIAPPTVPLGAMCLTVNGSGTVIVGGTNLIILNARNPQAGAILATNFALPSPPKSVAVAFGRAYVADDFSGLLVVNYYGPDTNGQPPAISLRANFPLNPPVVPPGSSVAVTIATVDDVQVRAVEFYINGGFAGLSGTAPFDFWLTTPATNNAQFTIRAKAIDTGLNVAWSETLTVSVDANATPPTVTNAFPLPASVNPPGTAAAQVFFDKGLDPGSMTPTSLQVFSAGADGLLGTADDLTVVGSVTYLGNPAALSFTASSPFAPGDYRAIVGVGVTDTYSNHLSSDYIWTFSIKTPVQWITNGSGDWFHPQNWSTANTPQAGDFVLINGTNPLDIVTFQGGSASLDSLTSTEPLILDKGTFSLARQSIVANDVTLLGDTLSVATGLDIAGQFNWEYATLDGGGVIAANGMDIAGAYLHIGKITLINRGHAVWHQPDNSGILIDDPATMIVNGAGGVFETQGRALATWTGYNPPYPTFNNQGLFHVTGPSNYAAIFQGVTFNNSGVVQIDAGALELAGIGGKASGEFKIAAGALLHFNANNQTTPASWIHGAGTVRASSGMSVLNGTYDVTGATIVDGNGQMIVNGDITNTGAIFATGSGRLTLSATLLNLSAPIYIDGGVLYLNSFSGKIEATGMTLTNLGILIGTADVTVSGPFSASNCIAIGPGRLITQGASTVGNLSLYPANLNSIPRPLDNTGYFSMVGDIFAGSALIRNLFGGVFDCAGDHRISLTYGATVTPALINAGMVVKSSGSGTFVIDGTIHNSGLIVAKTGKIMANGGLLQTGGEIRLAGGGIGGNPSFDMQSGLVTGAGTLEVFKFNNSGAIVSPGLSNAPVGLFHFTYAYNQSAGGTLAIDIVNASPTGYDKIVADGPCSLGGTLILTLDPGYQPVLGDTFRIFQSSALTGQFANIVRPNLGGGMKLAVTYDSTGATLTVVVGP